jgi:hypothetical protein
MRKLYILGTLILLAFALPAAAQVSQQPLPGVDLANTWTAPQTFSTYISLLPISAPTGASGKSLFYMDSSLNWPVFKPNSNTAYQLVLVSGAITSGQSVCFANSTTGGVTSCAGSGGNPAGGANAVQYEINSSTFGGIAPATSPQNVLQLLGELNSSGTGQTPAYYLPGISTRSVTGASDTIVLPDRAQQVYYSHSGAVATSIPAPSTSGFSNWVMKSVTSSGSTVTFTPTAGQISNNGGALAGTFAQQPSTTCTWTTLDNTNLQVNCPSAPSVTTSGSPSNGNLAKFSSGSAITNADLSGAVTTSGGTVTTLGSAVVAPANNVVSLNRKVVDIAVGDQSSSSVLTSAQLGPQKRLVFVEVAGTVTEIDVEADAGTPSVIVGYRNPAGTLVNLLSGALSTASAGANACSNTGGTTGLDGVTTCSATLQNTTVALGGYFELVSGTADGTAKLMTIHVIYQATGSL